MGPAGFSRFSWIALAATVAGLAVAGGRLAYASSSEEPKKYCSSGIGSQAAPLAITLNATLTGTVIVEDGRSLALFEPTGGTGLMHEGDAFADGTLLCEVQADRIVVGRGASRREIFLGWKGQPTVLALSRSVSPAAAEVASRTLPTFTPGNAQPVVSSGERLGARPAGEAGPLESRATNFRAMLERRQVQPAEQ
jgi:hypothetical protein